MPRGYTKDGKPYKQGFQKGHPNIWGFKQGKNHYNWKGGKRITYKGYMHIYKPNHPFCTNRSYILEHRLVMEKYLGRYLKPEEVVHHINGNKSDNRLKNLRLFANYKEHKSFELKLGRKVICPSCNHHFRIPGI